METIRLDLLGGFQVGASGGVVIPISSKKGRALLAYLALQQRAQTRQKLSGLLWSAREQAQAHSSLRHELVELRRAFGAIVPSPLLIEGDSVSFAPGAVTTDVADFERGTKVDSPNELQSAARHYRGALLDGLVIRDSVFDEWLTQERERLHEAAIAILDRLSARSTGAAALVAAQQLLSLDPLREASHRALMRIHAEQGETDLAFRQSQACRQLLREELNVEPCHETDLLHQQIRDGTLKPSTAGLAAQAIPARPAVRTEAGKPLMAVLPFGVFGGDPQLDAIADGLVEDITTGMARFRLISVASRHFTQPYRDRAIEVPQLRRDIGAHYALTGSLRRSSEGIRATVQLIETQIGRELWAERYDRALSDAFFVQDDLAQAIVAEIEHVLVAAEHRRALESGLGEQRILNQKAGWHLFRFTREDNAKAIDLLRRAIVENPDADRRYQGLSLALGIDLAFGWAEQPEETIVEMLAAGERSVSLREPDAWNHAALSWGLMFARQFERAIADVKRMIELNPNSGVSFGVGSLILTHCGDAEAALDLLAKARRMAPQAPFMFNYLCSGAISLYRLSRYDEAADMAESAALRRPNYFQPRLILSAALARKGEAPRAQAALTAACQLAPPMSVE